MNILGVIFDSKLTWNELIANCISKAKKTRFGLRLLRKYFNQAEMRNLLDANFYSVVYYNSVIWLTPELKSPLRQSLLSIFANALRTCLKNENHEISFERLHLNAKKCTPSQIMLDQASLQFLKFSTE